MLPGQHRLRYSADVVRVRRTGRRWQHSLLALYVVKGRGDEPTRFAFVAGRQVGTAVRRNRVKRQLREVVRAQLWRIEPGADCLVIARGKADTASFGELKVALEQLLAGAAVLQSDTPVEAKSSTGR